MIIVLIPKVNLQDLNPFQPQIRPKLTLSRSNSIRRVILITTNQKSDRIISYPRNNPHSTNLTEISTMSTIQLNIPEEILISLKETPETLARELQLLAAVKLFELGKLSSGRAAQLAGISRVEFLMLLGCYQVSPFSLTTEELERDVNNA